MPKCSNDHRQGYSLRLRHLRAETVSGRLQASLWLSRRVGESQLPVVPAAAPPPHVTLTVTRSGSPEGRPVMEASIAGIAALGPHRLVGTGGRRGRRPGTVRGVGLAVAYGAIAVRCPPLVATTHPSAWLFFLLGLRSTRSPNQKGKSIMTTGSSARSSWLEANWPGALRLGPQSRIPARRPPLRVPDE